MVCQARSSILATLFCVLSFAASAQSEPAFVENRGQWDAQVRFLARTPGVDVWLTESGVVYDFHRSERLDAPAFDPRRWSTPGEVVDVRRTGHIVRVEFVGGKPSPVGGVGLQEAYTNYFLGNSPSQWFTRVPQFDEAKSEQIYKGIEARWYTQSGVPRYDLIVAPGADPSQIALRFVGVRGITSDGQVLSIPTALGVVSHRDLFAYQPTPVGKKQVSCRMRVEGNVLRFEVPNYDRSRPLVIDPLVWSTLIGGAGDERAVSMATDADGAPVISGSVNSPAFPVTSGAYQIAVSTPASFVTKFKPDGRSLAWSTFFGMAAGTLTVRDIAVGPTGIVWITGRTDSPYMPTQPRSYDRTYNGGSDGFLASLSADGSSLLVSTYFGGSSYEEPNGIALDSLGRPVVVGRTLSTDFPVSAGAFDTANPEANDGFVSRFSSDCRTLIASTFLGGTGTGADNVQDVKVDSLARVVVVGSTVTPDFPTTEGAFKRAASSPLLLDSLGNRLLTDSDPALLGGLGPSDAFVSRLSLNLKSLESSTLLGGSTGDVGFRVALDSSSNAVLIGSTDSADFPTTEGAFNRIKEPGTMAFVSKVNPSATKLLQSTLWVPSSQLYAVGVNSRDEIILGGRAYLDSFPVTLDSFDVSFGGTNEGTLSILNKFGTRLLYSSFVGGNSEDEAFAVLSSGDDSLFAAGSTLSADFPTTTGAFSRTPKGLSDVFLMKVAIRRPVSLSLSRSSVVGGFGLEGTVTLDKSAPPNGAKVIISSTPALLETQVVKVAPGALSKKFSIPTPSVVAKTTIQIKATAGGKTVSQSLILNVGGLIGLSLNPSTVVSGQSSTGTVTLSGKAPAGGRVVKLSTTAPAVLPLSVTVPAGASSATFTCTSVGGGISAGGLVIAKLGTVQLEATLTIIPFDIGSP